MTIKDIKTKFDIYKYLDKKYTLQSNCEFIANIEKTSDTHFRLDVDGYNPTSNLNKLIEDISTWTSSLKYPIRFFNKNIVERYRYESFIGWYLLKFGFKPSSKGFVLKRNNQQNMLSYQEHIYVDIEDDHIKFNLFYQDDYSFVSTKSNLDFDEIVVTINSLILPTRLLDAKWNIEQLLLLDVDNTTKDEIKTFISNLIK